MRFSGLSAVPEVSAANDNLRFRLLCSSDQLKDKELIALSANGDTLEAVTKVIRAYSEAKVEYYKVTWAADDAFVEVGVDRPIGETAMALITELGEALM